MEHQGNKENETEVFETQGLSPFHISDRQKVTDPEDPTLEKNDSKKKRTTLRHIIFKLQEAKGKSKEKILQKARSDDKQLTCKGTRLRMTLHFLSEARKVKSTAKYLECWGKKKSTSNFIASEIIKENERDFHLQQTYTLQNRSKKVLQREGPSISQKLLYVKKNTEVINEGKMNYFLS